jgi:FkbM family methyltransferase
MWVSEVFKDSAPGFFLDFGAFDGLEISNTYYLEKNLGWQGICVEPNFRFFPDLCRNRNSICLNGALWSTSGMQMNFIDAHGLSGIQGLSGELTSGIQLKNSSGIISVTTLHPMEVLRNFSAPTKIHYMSLDTEGAELPIILGIDFNMYEIALITVEHNHDEDRKNSIRDILCNKFNYDVVEVKNEDWFWKTTTISEITKIPVSRIISPRVVAEEVEHLYGVRA